MEFFLDIVNSRFSFVCALIFMVIGAEYILRIITRKEHIIQNYISELNTIMKAGVLAAAILGFLFCVPFKYLVVLNGNNYPLSKMPSGDYCYYAKVTKDNNKSYTVPVTIYKYDGQCDVSEIHFTTETLKVHGFGLLNKNGECKVETMDGQQFKVKVTSQLTSLPQSSKNKAKPDVIDIVVRMAGVIGALVTAGSVLITDKGKENKASN